MQNSHTLLNIPFNSRLSYVKPDRAIHTLKTAIAEISCNNLAYLIIICLFIVLLGRGEGGLQPCPGRMPLLKGELVLAKASFLLAVTEYKEYNPHITLWNMFPNSLLSTGKSFLFSFCPRMEKALGGSAEASSHLKAMGSLM